MECPPYPLDPPALMRDLLRTAIEAARAASRVHVNRLDGVESATVTEKGISDFVSAIDLEAQAAALARIRADFPDHMILAEEDDGSPAPNLAPPPGEPVWVVDPLDGTTNFLHRHPAWCASVGVVIDGTPAAGAVLAGATGELWSGSPEEGSLCNGRPIRVSSVRRPALALVGTGFPFKAPDRIPEHLEQLERVLRKASGVRRGGSAALDLCYLSQGSLDAFWELVLHPWDMAAGLAILTGAGGCARSLDGGPLDGLHPAGVLAANDPELLEWLADTLAGEASRQG
jgi:myo-inositol-1(or 4)-monophosphatase